MKVSAIVPALNEAERINAVLIPLKAASAVSEIIVVDDGSSDGTAQVARRCRVEVLSLPENRGKAMALDHGIRLAQHDTLLFADADLVGLRNDHVNRLIKAYEQAQQQKLPVMVIGVFRNGRLNTDLAQTIAPYLSGQRVLSKDLWQKLRVTEKTEFGVEIALTKLAIKEGWQQKLVELDGVTHVMKEQKRGFSRGFADRMRMYGDIVRSVFTKVA